MRSSNEEGLGGSVDASEVGGGGVGEQRQELARRLDCACEAGVFAVQGDDSHAKCTSSAGVRCCAAAGEVRTVVLA